MKPTQNIELQEKLYRQYMEFFENAERQRRWNLFALCSGEQPESGPLRVPSVWGRPDVGGRGGLRPLPRWSGASPSWRDGLRVVPSRAILRPASDPV